MSPPEPGAVVAAAADLAADLAAASDVEARLKAGAELQALVLRTSPAAVSSAILCSQRDPTVSWCAVWVSQMA